MPRLLPTAVAVSGILVAAALTATRFTAPMEGAASDEALYNLLANALHDPQLAPGPTPGASPLPISPVPADPDSPRQDTSRVEAPQPEGAALARATSEPYAWVSRAAQVDSAALRDWLGRWVMATSLPANDTIRITLRRFSWRRGCPLVSTLVAMETRVDGESRIAGIAGTCPPVRLAQE